MFATLGRLNNTRMPCTAKIKCLRFGAVTVPPAPRDNGILLKLHCLSHRKNADPFGHLIRLKRKLFLIRLFAPSRGLLLAAQVQSCHLWWLKSYLACAL